MKKKIVALLTAVALACCGCSANEENTDRGRIIQTIKTGFNHKVIVDTDTGVMYYICIETGVTPLYNADGTLRTWEE